MICFQFVLVFLLLCKPSSLRYKIYSECTVRFSMQTHAYNQNQDSRHIHQPEPPCAFCPYSRFLYPALAGSATSLHSVSSQHFITMITNQILPMSAVFIFLCGFLYKYPTSFLFSSVIPPFKPTSASPLITVDRCLGYFQYGTIISKAAVSTLFSNYFLRPH